MIPSEPKKLDMPFAYEGGRNEIPTTGGEDTGNASLSVGFPPITSQPLSQGGIPPQRKDFNGILYALSAHTHYQQSGGMYSWDETLDYIQNCIVTYNGSIYICLATNGANTTAGAITPGTNANYWQTLYSFLQSGDASNVGSSTNPVYVSNGKMVASTGTVGGTSRPIYLNSGVLTALTGTVGSGTRPVYMSNGTITASGSTVGNSSTPVYLNSGTITACTSTSSYTDGITSSSRSDGYIQFSSGIKIQWGVTNPSRNTQYIYFPVSFSNTNYSIFINAIDTTDPFYVSARDREYARIALESGSTDHYVSWLAIGY